MQPKDFQRNLSCWVAAVRTNYVVLLLFTLIVYFPRLFLSCAVFMLAQFLRLIARLIGAAEGRPVENRRILVITDYLPPQTHGIAIRVAAYVKEMRAKGHEVVMFSTATGKASSSFDHPNIPALVNPFNLNNKVGYTPGVKLAWYLGANTWDVVHLVFPSVIGVFVLSCCAWRSIPVYCSHHVEMDMFAHKHVLFWPIASFGLFMYNLVGKWPAMLWGTINTAPTLIFAKAHIGEGNDRVLRRAPSGTHNHFTPTPDSDTERRDIRLSRFGVDDESTKVILMVQRLSAEKGTERIFQAFVKKEKGGHGVEGKLVIAGDGPSRHALEKEASKLGLPVVFLGNVPHHDLPKLYRAADTFVTMSLSETFGLTCLEAQMCGCPAVMPYCDVFNEIWSPESDIALLKVPNEWRYNIPDEGVNYKELASAMSAATKDGRKFLKANPVNQTWKVATEELLGHYEEAIEMNRKRREKSGDMIRRMDHMLRIAVMLAIALWVLSRYYNVYLRVRQFIQPFLQAMQQ